MFWLGLLTAATVSSPMLTLRGDPTRMQQVVWNLLSNGVKFTPSVGSVQVRLQRINSHVEVVVTDTGVGIHAGFLPHVFDRFRQADGSTTRIYGGLGLGLWIARQIVDHRGLLAEHCIAQAEIFGPVLVAIPHDGDDDAVRIANDSIYGLSGAVTSASSASSHGAQSAISGGDGRRSPAPLGALPGKHFVIDVRYGRCASSIEARASQRRS